MRAVRGIGAAAVVVVGLGGCDQIIGYQTPVIIDAATACANGIKDFGETGVDCGGGTCPPCADGMDCKVDSDCTSNLCLDGSCATPTCHDGVQDGQETDVDCGGPVCPPCHAGETCKLGRDCVSDICTGGICQLSCTDNVKDGDETDIDCGGSVCPPCAIGKMCLKNSDCQSGICTAGVCADFLVWAESFGPTGGGSTLVGLGVDAAGDAVLGATFGGEANFGGATYDALNEGVAFARYDPSGTHLWDAGFPGGSTFQESLTLDAFAVSPSGAFVGAGTFADATLNFGTLADLENPFPGFTSAFVVRFAEDNAASWGTAFGIENGLQPPAFEGVAPDTSQGAIVVGSAEGAYDVGTTPVQTADPYVVDLGGFPGWGQAFKNGADVSFSAVTTSATGEVVAVGQGAGSLDFGGGPLVIGSDGGSGFGGFVVAFTSLGAYAWDGAFNAQPGALAVDSSGNVIISGISRAPSTLAWGRSWARARGCRSSS